MRHIDEILVIFKQHTDRIQSEFEECVENAFVRVGGEDLYSKLDELSGLEPHVHSPEFLRQT